VAVWEIARWVRIHGRDGPLRDDLLALPRGRASACPLIDAATPPRYARRALHPTTTAASSNASLLPDRSRMTENLPHVIRCHIEQSREKRSGQNPARWQN